MMYTFLVIAACLALTKATIPEKKIVCHVAGKTANVSTIDPSLCTHLIYTFVGLHEDDVIILNPMSDLPYPWGRAGFARVDALRRKNPDLKTMVAIKEIDHGSRFSQMISKAQSREKFVDNVVKFVKRWNFDGLALYWHYSILDNNAVRNEKNYMELLRMLRKRFDGEGLILSTAVVATEFLASGGYNISEMSKYFDFISLLAYSVEGPWGRETSFEAPLYASPSDTTLKKTMSIEASVLYWLTHGAPKDKLILSAPAAGRRFTLQNPEENGVGAPIHHDNESNLGELGRLAYREICRLYKAGDWNFVFDDKRRVPYTYKGDQWIGYDNVKSVREKAEYITRLNLGGAMVWNIHQDDYEGTCGETYPILKTLNAILRNRGPVPEDTTPVAVSTSSKSGTVPCIATEFVLFREIPSN